MPRASKDIPRLLVVRTFEISHVDGGLTTCADFKPTSVIFAPHQYNDIVISDLGILIWLFSIIGSIYMFGFGPVFRNYLVPYLWFVSIISSKVSGADPICH